jgi:16S rRNA (cytosine967-C5)-methyltransferase
MTISPARAAAFDILEKIERDGSFSSDLLAQAAATLESRDRGLCNELVLGVLRRKLLLDRLIDDFSGGKRLDLAVRNAARIGLYQALFLDRIPRHSLVNESVNLTGRAGKSSAKGFVNALLRRAPSSVPELAFTDEIERISVLTSHPRWLIDRWASAFGEERAASIAAANNEQPPLAFRLTPDAGEIEIPPGAVESRIVPGCYLSATASEELLELARRGGVYFQDEASQIVGGAVRLGYQGRFLDACAAPGGKFTQIVANNPGSTVVGIDISHARVVTTKALLAARGLADAPIVRADAEGSFPFEEEAFDAVLVDAPCSGTGTIRHNPEIRYLVSEAAIAANHDKQLNILHNASKLVKRGGKVFYSTCSLEPEENEAVVEQFLRTAAGSFERIDPDLPGRFITENGFARTFPDRDGLDGFFIAVVRRR